MKKSSFNYNELIDCANGKLFGPGNAKLPSPPMLMFDRITEINDIIARANVIDVTKLSNDGKVIFGSTVFLENLDTGEKIDYKIVGKDEADLKKKLLYFQSPIGKGLIGKNKGDLVEINTPAGTKNFEIVDVKYV